MKNIEQYLLHASGIYAMLTWNKEQQQIGTPTKITKQTLYIHPLTSRFFALGISKKKNVSNIPFLAIQPSESNWMKLIEWDKVYIRTRDMHLYVVSKLIKGDNIEYPDIPPFAIAISFDTLEKINILEKIETLEGREYRQETGQIYINFHSYIFKLPIVKLEKDQPYLEQSREVINYSDILTNKEKQLQDVFSTDSPPEFLGDVNAAAAINSSYWQKLNNLLDKTNKKK